MIGVAPRSEPDRERPDPARPRLGSGRDLAEVIDVHAGLAPTVVDRAVVPSNEDAVQLAVRDAIRLRRSVCVAGGRHAMGGQAFRIGGVLVDTRWLDRTRSFDPVRGLLEVEAGARWQALHAFLRRAQKNRPRPWALAQVPAWSDDGTVGGAVSVNAHGLALGRPPLGADVAALRIVDGGGEVRVARRDAHAGLFRAALGGYGLVGVITAVSLRLQARQTLRVHTEVDPPGGPWVALLGAAREGALYGDALLCCDESSDAFLRGSAVTTYRPVDPFMTNVPAPTGVGPSSTPSDVARPFDRMVARRFRLHGRTIRSDSLPFHALPDMDARLRDEPIGAGHRATEIIAELCVPGALLQKLLDEVRGLLRAADMDVTRATVRLVDRDRDALWAWAWSPWASLTLGVRAERTREGLTAAAAALEAMTSRAVELGGTFHPGYHRFASRELMDRGHPGFAAFLGAKRTLDPEERFQSDWYAHYRDPLVPEV